MKALIQRVMSASVTVEGEVIGEIGRGILLFLGVEKQDDAEQVSRLVDKVLNYRIFENDEGKMGLSLKDVGGELLVVSQFTLVADSRKGTKPGFSTAAAPEHGRRLYEQFVSSAEKGLEHVATGRFGADMKVALINDGPVTFLLEAR